jgi:hypothetical protein
MFRRIRKLVWPNRERLLSLVMLPAFFLATLPHTACICADGHRESSCNVWACRAGAPESSKAASCGRSCCKDCRAKQERNCCHKNAGESAKHDSMHVSGLVISTGSCCHPIIEAPAAAIATNKAKQASDQLIAAVVHPLPALVSTVAVRPAFERIHTSTPPPLDAVIVYLHLTI